MVTYTGELAGLTAGVCCRQLQREAEPGQLSTSLGGRLLFVCGQTTAEEDDPKETA